MAKVLKKIFDPAIDEVVQNYTIQSWHVSQSVDAFTALEAYDITLSGSLVVTGSVAIHTLPNSPQNGVVLYDDTTGLLYYTASSAFAVNNYYTSSVTQSITSSVVNNVINGSVINQTIISSSINEVAPSNQYIQYNSGSTFGASVNFQYVYPLNSLQQGNGTVAAGQYSHAEGIYTSASADYSHAEGVDTISVGPFSHAEGETTNSYGTASHAEGFSCTSTGPYSHAEGNASIAFGDSSHAEGQSTYARGAGTHAEGYQTYAQGLYSHTEGQNTLTLGNYSHAEGSLTTASANYSHASGLWTVTQGNYQSVVGSYNFTSTSPSAFIVGNGTSDTSRSNLIFASGSLLQVTGSVEITQNLTGKGGYRPNTRLTDSALDPTLLVTDHVVLIAPTSPGGIVYLPASPVTNMQLVIMRTEITSAFTVAPLGGYLINGLSSYTFPTTAFTRKTFTFFGGRWFVESN